MQGQVKYVNRGVEHFGTYRIDGRMLELTCRYGKRRSVLGLFEARALARKLLKVLVMKAERESAAQVTDQITAQVTDQITAQVPRPASVETTGPKVAARLPQPAQPKPSSAAGWASMPAIQADAEAKRRAAVIAASAAP